MREAEEIARTYLHEAEAARDGPHAAHARTWLGLTLLNQGKLSGAESALERVLADWRPAPDGGQTKRLSTKRSSEKSATPIEPHHQPDPQHRPNSRLEAAYHRADTAIQRVVDLVAAA